MASVVQTFFKPLGSFSLSLERDTKDLRSQLDKTRVNHGAPVLSCIENIRLEIEDMQGKAEVLHRSLSSTIQNGGDGCSLRDITTSGASLLMYSDNQLRLLQDTLSQYGYMKEDTTESSADSLKGKRLCLAEELTMVVSKQKSVETMTCMDGTRILDTTKILPTEDDTELTQTLSDKNILAHGDETEASGNDRDPNNGEKERDNDDESEFLGNGDEIECETSNQSEPTCTVSRCATPTLLDAGLSATTLAALHGGSTCTKSSTMSPVLASRNEPVFHPKTPLALKQQINMNMNMNMNILTQENENENVSDAIAYESGGSLKTPSNVGMFNEIDALDVTSYGIKSVDVLLAEPMQSQHSTVEEQDSIDQQEHTEQHVNDIVDVQEQVTDLAREGDNDMSDTATSSNNNNNNRNNNNINSVHKSNDNNYDDDDAVLGATIAKSAALVEYEQAMEVEAMFRPISLKEFEVKPKYVALTLEDVNSALTHMKTCVLATAASPSDVFFTLETIQDEMGLGSNAGVLILILLLTKRLTQRLEDGKTLYYFVGASTGASTT